MAQRVKVIVDCIDDLDESTPATTTRTFRVHGRRGREIDLCEENAAQFDEQFAEWTQGRMRRRFTVGGQEHELWLTPEEAERFDAMVEFWTSKSRKVEVDKDRRPGRVRTSHLPTIEPKPTKGERWWLNPSPPFSRETARAFTRARKIVREWARWNGWPALGTRGVVPRAAYEQWFDKVWSTLDEPTWDAGEAASLPPQRGTPRKQRRNTKTTSIAT